MDNNNNSNHNPNPWIKHVQKYASKEFISYRDALIDTKCRTSYWTEKNVGKEADFYALVTQTQDIGFCDDVCEKHSRDPKYANIREKEVLDVLHAYGVTKLGMGAHKKICSVCKKLGI